MHYQNIISLKNMRINKQFIEAFNLKIHPWDMNKTIEVITNNIGNKQKPYKHIVVNVAKLVTAQRNLLLKESINDSDIVNIDGWPIVIVLRLLGYNIPERVAGIDLFIKLLEISEQKRFKVFFLGAKQEILEKMVGHLRIKYPELLISGYQNGYYTEKEEIKIVKLINSLEPDILFVGISSPQKEIFINKYSEEMNIPFTMGVGGSFDVLAGKVSRAPLWMQKYGLEWFYRLCQEPKRMWKRYLLTNTLFIILSIKELLVHHAKRL